MGGPWRRVAEFGLGARPDSFAGELLRRGFALHLVGVLGAAHGDVGYNSWLVEQEASFGRCPSFAVTPRR